MLKQCTKQTPLWLQTAPTSHMQTDLHLSPLRLHRRNNHARQSQHQASKHQVTELLRQKTRAKWDWQVACFSSRQDPSSEKVGSREAFTSTQRSKARRAVPRCQPPSWPGALPHWLGPPGQSLTPQGHTAHRPQPRSCRRRARTARTGRAHTGRTLPSRPQLAHTRSRPWSPPRTGL